MNTFTKKLFDDFAGDRGYTLLFAVLTASLVLGVSVFVLSVSRKQYILSAAARDSMYAFYNADSGIECASQALSTIATSSPSNEIACTGTAIPLAAFSPVSGVSGFSDSPAPYRSSGTKIDLSSGCAVITFTIGSDATDSSAKSTIESRGYNICDETGPAQSPRTVERALKLTYHQ